MFLNCTRFGFELINQKMFEMKNLKMTQFTYFVISHLKVIVVKMLIYHIWSLPSKTPICDMIIIKLFTRLTNLFQ